MKSPFLFTLLWVCLLFQSQAQRPFVTLWDMKISGKGNTEIQMTISMSDTVTYEWETYPGKVLSGTGRVFNGGPIFTGLPADSLILFRLSPQNINSFQASTDDVRRLIDVQQWGDVQWRSMVQMFRHCNNLQISAVDTPRLQLVSSLNNMFENCYVLNGPSNIGQWNTSSVKQMRGVFMNCYAFNQPINTWKTDSVTHFSDMFFQARKFNQALNTWNTGAAISMEGMFNAADSFNQNINAWNTANVTTMRAMFASTINFNQDLNNWNTSKVTNFNGMFDNAKSFNGNVSNWNVSNGVNFAAMFSRAKAFNKDLNSWNVSKGLDMGSMFAVAESFNGNIANWNTGACSTMFLMFAGARVFNRDISRWDVSNVKNMARMFEFTDSFDQDISQWDVANVETFSGMFKNANAFDRNVGAWNLKQGVNIDLGLSNISCFNYTQTIIGWANKNPSIRNVRLFANGLEMGVEGAISRDSLLQNRGWTIQSDIAIGKQCPANPQYFITHWDMRNNGQSDSSISFAITTQSNVHFKWRTLAGTVKGEGMSSSQAIQINGLPKDSIIRIELENKHLQSVNIGNSADKLRLTEISLWGNTQWTHLDQAFSGCRNLKVMAKDQPNFSSVSTTKEMFKNCDQLQGNKFMEEWALETITDMRDMFAGAKKLNVYTGKWRFKKGALLEGLLDSTAISCDNHTAAIRAWSQAEGLPDTLKIGVSGLQYGSYASEAYDFLATSKKWDLYGDTLSTATCKKSGFVLVWDLSLKGAASFGQSSIGITLGLKDTVKIIAEEISPGNRVDSFWVTQSSFNYNKFPLASKIRMTLEAKNLQTFAPIITSGNGVALIDIEQWGAVEWTSLNNAFNGCSNLRMSAKDEPDLRKVRNMQYMFQNCTSLDFNKAMRNWKTDSVLEMGFMFTNAKKFNEDISKWNVQRVENFQYMFSETDSFNADLSQWTPQNLKFADRMFENAKSFNRNIGQWDMSKITGGINAMFRNAASFNQNVGAWKLQPGLGLNNLFDYSGMNCENYGATLNGWAVGNPLLVRRILGVEGLYYGKESLDARDVLINQRGWTIQRDTFTYADCGNSAFVTEWNLDTTGSAPGTIVLPVVTSGIGFYAWEELGGQGRKGQDSFSGSVLRISGLDAIKQLKLSIYADSFHSIQMKNSADARRLIAIVNWGNIKWKTFESAFANCSNVKVLAFDKPNLDSVTSLKGMFQDCKQLSNIPFMDYWNTRSITDFSYMFKGALLFNQSMEKWNMSAALTLESMFDSALLFNRDLSSWKVSSVQNMKGMFRYAQSFNRNLAAWNLHPTVSLDRLFDSSGVNCQNYSASLIAWSRTNLSNRVLGAAGIQYDSLGKQARDALQSRLNWTFVGDVYASSGCGQYEFVMVFDLSKGTIGSDLDFSVTATDTVFYTWEAVDLQGVSGTGFIAGTRFARTNLPSGQRIRVRFNPTKLTGILMDLVAHRVKVESIEQWGDVKWVNLNGAFLNCTHMQVRAWDAPDLSRCTSLNTMFRGCNAMTGVQSFPFWNTQSIKTMIGMFREASAFVGDVSNWDMGAVENTAEMFMMAEKFNADISRWNVSSNKNFLNMFLGAKLFNQNVGVWNIASALNLSGMFAGASSFDQDLSNWNFQQKVLNSFLDNSGLSCLHYSRLLMSLAGQLPSNAVNVSMGAINLEYGLSALQARRYLTGTLNWTINGDKPNSGICADPSDGFAFATQWDMSQVGNTPTSIKFTLDNSDSIFYYWETYPGKQNHRMGFLKDSIAILDSLPADSLIRLYLFPYGVKSFAMQGSPDVLRLQSVLSWGKVKWTAMDYAFDKCENLQVEALDVPDLSALTSLKGMFRACTSLRKIPMLNKWNTGTVKDLSFWMDSAVLFNDTLLDWNTSSVITFESMFEDAKNFDQPLYAWNTSKAKTMKKMFSGAEAFNQKIETWSLDSIEDMSYLFQNAISYNQPVELLDISRLTSLEGFFAGAQAFNQSLQKWDVQEITNFGSMFNGASQFNQDITKWNTSKAVSFDSMFKKAQTFNQNITKWNTLRATNMAGMFSGASSFDQNLGVWALRPTIVLNDMLDSSGMSCVNYSSTLIGWAAAAPITFKTLGAAGLEFGTNAQSARNTLVSRAWSIQGDRNAGVACLPPAFITQWDLSIPGSSDTSLSIPIVSTGQVSFFWEELSPGSASGQGISQGDSLYLTGLPAKTRIQLHVLPVNFSQIKMNQATDRNRLLLIEQWGTNAWNSMEQAFKGCENLQITTTAGTPNLSNALNAEEMFAGCIRLNSPSNIGAWNVSNIQNMKGMFEGASQFNQNIANWNVSNVVDFSNMFSNARDFNQNIGNWNTRSAKRFEGMFRFATSFAQNIQNWNTDLVENTAFMFDSAILFAGDLSRWNLAKVQNMEAMFQNARQFRSNLSGWNTRSCLSFKNTFNRAVSFESDLANWTFLPQVALEGFLDSTALSCLQYSSLLIKWADSLLAFNNKKVGAKGLFYGTTAEPSRAKLVQQANWSIVGDQPGNATCAPLEFVTLWDMAKSGSGQRSITFGITCTDTVYYTWKSYPGGALKGNGKVFGPAISLSNLPADSIVEIALSPEHLKGIAVGIAGDTLRLIEVKQWGVSSWTSLDKAFKGCRNLQFTNRFLPDFSHLRSVSEMFAETPGIDYPKDMDQWTMDSVANFNAMFRACSSFNEDVTQWNTVSATNMSFMFAGATVFNKPIGSWNTASVKNMEHMFEAATSFSESIEQWNVEKVGSMTAMFKQAVLFNGKLSNWNTQNVVSMQSMFEEALAFNGEIENWNLSSLTNASKMFKNAKQFNKPLQTWDVSKIDAMQEIFANAVSFDQNLGEWKLRNNADLSRALDSCGMQMFNYDSTLIQWYDKGAENVTLGAKGLVYCAASPQRFMMTQSLAQSGLNWTITGDAALAVIPFIPIAKTTITPVAICGNSYLNPVDISQKILEFDPNGNNTGSQFFRISNNALDALPSYMQNDSGYYTYADSFQVFRTGHLLYQVLTQYNPDANGYKLKVYFDSASLTNQELDLPSQTTLTKSRWLVVYSDSSSTFFDTAMFNHRSKWLVPQETGVEQGVHYAVFELDSGGVIGYVTQFDRNLHAREFLQNPFSVSTYPNPAFDHIVIEIPLIADEANIELWSINGKLVQSWSLKQAKEKLPLLPHSQGTYFLKIYCNNEVFLRKVILHNQ